MKRTLLLLTTLVSLSCYAQSELDSEAISKINREVASQIDSVKGDMIDRARSKSEIEYAADTMRIDMFCRLSMDIDWSTAGMYRSVWHSYEEYDKLLNKYYDLLMHSLPDQERVILKEAQLSWLSYRDNEFKLIAKKYSGEAGSIAPLLRSGEMLQLLKDRVQQLYNHYSLISEK